MTATSLTNTGHALPKGQQLGASPLPCTLPGLDGSLTLHQMIGSGSYGKVYLAKTSEGKLRAAKCIPLPTGTATGDHVESSPQSEAELLKLVKHSNVIRLYDSKIIDGRLWLSMEYARLGNLLSYLQTDNRKSFAEDELAVVAQSLLKALKSIHKRQVIHRDVKPTNILVTQDGKIKLGDMGTSCLAANNRNSVQGTFQYLAPEIFQAQSYDSKVDIWALGMTLLELAQGFSPFESKHFAHVLYHLVDAPAAPTLANHSAHSNSLVDFLAKCLTLNPAERPTAPQLLKHPFLKKAAKHLPLGRRNTTAKPVMSLSSIFGSIETSSSMSSAASSESFHSGSSSDSDHVRPSLEIEFLNKAARESAFTSPSIQILA